MSDDGLSPFENLISSSPLQVEFKLLEENFLKLSFIFALLNCYLLGFDLVCFMIFFASYFKFVCTEYYVFYSLNILGVIFVIMMIALGNSTINLGSILLNKYNKYIRFYLILMAFLLISKSFRFIYYLWYLKEERLTYKICIEVDIVEEYEIVFFSHLHLLLLLFLIGLKLKIRFSRLKYLIEQMNENERIVF